MNKYQEYIILLLEIIIKKLVIKLNIEVIIKKKH